MWHSVAPQRKERRIKCGFWYATVPYVNDVFPFLMLIDILDVKLVVEQLVKVKSHECILFLKYFHFDNVLRMSLNVRFIPTYSLPTLRYMYDITDSLCTYYYTRAQSHILTAASLSLEDVVRWSASSERGNSNSGGTLQQRQHFAKGDTITMTIIIMTRRIGCGRGDFIHWPDYKHLIRHCIITIGFNNISLKVFRLPS